MRVLGLVLGTSVVQEQCGGPGLSSVMRLGCSQSGAGAGPWGPPSASPVLRCQGFSTCFLPVDLFELPPSVVASKQRLCLCGGPGPQHGAPAEGLGLRGLPPCSLRGQGASFPLLTCQKPVQVPGRECRSLLSVGAQSKNLGLYFKSIVVKNHCSGRSGSLKATSAAQGL